MWVESMEETDLRRVEVLTTNICVMLHLNGERRDLSGSEETISIIRPRDGRACDLLSWFHQAGCSTVYGAERLVVHTAIVLQV